MADDLRTLLEQEVTLREHLRNPAILHRFVLRNGKPFSARGRIGHRRKAKQCFMNAAHFVIHKDRGTYVEGFAINRKFAFPFHHAWVSISGDDAMDPTLESADYEYFGVPFSITTVNREINRNECYGLLDTGMYNIRLMFERDPELKLVAERVIGREIKLEERSTT